MNYTLLLISLLLTTSFSLKLSDIGRNDWHLENLGQISHIQLIQNKLFYLSKQNLLGHIKLDSGLIDSRITLSPNQKLLSVNERQVTFLTDTNQIITYKTHNLQRNANNKFVNDKILKPIKSYLKSHDGKGVFINDQKNIRFYPLDNTIESQSDFNQIYTAKPHQIIQKLLFVGDKLYAVILTDMLFGFRQIINGKLDDFETILGFADEDYPSGWSITQAWEQDNSIVIVLYHKVANKHHTLVLTRQFQTNYKQPAMYHQLIITQLKFCSKFYDLKKKQEIERLNILYDSHLNIDYILEDGEDKLTIIKSGNRYTSIPKPASGIKWRRVFLLQKSETSFVFVAQYRDMTLEAYSIENGAEKKLWTREEGLAFIDKVLFMKYPFSDHLDNEYHRNLLSPAYLEMGIAEKLMKVPVHVALRVRQEISDLVQLIINSLQSFLDFSKITSIDLKSLTKFTMSEEQQLKLGLKKYIIAVTKNGGIYSIDTKSRNILWKKYRNIKDQSIVALIDLRKDYELEAAVLVTYDNSAKELVLQEIKEDGTIETLDRIACPILPTIHKLNHESLVISYGDKTMKYRLGASHTHEKHFYFYTEEANRIVGWKQMDSSVVEIWNFNLDEGERIIATASAYKSEQRSHIPLFDNGKVIFKNVDFTNMAVLTSKNATSMSLFIINGMTGQVLFNEYRSGLNLNHPINMAYDENNVLVTFYNNRNKLYQVWTVEQYQEKIESSALNMIKNYLEGQEYKPSRNRENIIFLSEVYGSPVSIKKMFISDSKQSIIRRNLFIVTRDDKLYMIGRQLVSTRRPKQTALFSNQVYPPYQYLLPYEPTKFFSYNLDLYGLKDVQFSPTDMESTIFLLTYGTDMYMLRVAPDMPFDMITDDFNYLVLVAIMIGVTVGVLILRHKAKKAKLIKPHRD